MADLVNPVRIKFLPSLAFNIARRRSTTNKATKPPSKNWAQAFQKRHPALKSQRMKAMDWNRHDRNIYDKIIHWFEVIGKVLNDSAVLLENVYNIDETGVMLCMLNFVKVFVSKDDKRDYRGAGVKRTTVTAIECISGNDAMKGRKNRGRKRKNTILEVDDPGAEPEEAHAAKELQAKRKRGRKRKSVVEVADDTEPEPEPEPEPEVARTIEASVSWRAPVAHMY
ncbi:uncharacterized protein LY89DRAFT_784821 [Mollisia scopiformis]|uniref:Uncharacterized protein n=1 Tax=Mollisia scopiformis TaxID=149040 RepID=A0A194X2E8_MOLSC|nr:uncharacterized protein LY89DRAFT_784821 [Mollisia scopiformis]KUJ14007.1 hypothetical protein LY89DRAFT_784821 [Mollisia scopiformis]